jgi:hypothetical protein
MLTRIEIGTREHILQWLESKDPTTEYCWEASCPAESYAAEHGLDDVPWESPLSPLAGQFPRTWGALAQRAREAVDGTASNSW